MKDDATIQCKRAVKFDFHTGAEYEDGPCPQTILTETANYRDGIWAQYVEAAVWALVAINGEASTRTHGEGVLGPARCLVSHFHESGLVSEFGSEPVH